MVVMGVVYYLGDILDLFLKDNMQQDARSTRDVDSRLSALTPVTV